MGRSPDEKTNVGAAFGVGQRAHATEQPSPWSALLTSLA